MLLKNLKTQKRGNISFLTLTAVIIFAVLFLLIFDLCQVFIAREETKKASDAASLAVAQNLLFFENLDCNKMAEEVTQRNNCTLVECRHDYDEVQVTVERKLDFILVDKFISKYSSVKSTSRAKVIYPWDGQFDYCDTYEFVY
jgi:secretion/DNA translocation related TadE-like protein